MCVWGGGCDVTTWTKVVVIRIEYMSDELVPRV